MSAGGQLRATLVALWVALGVAAGPSAAAAQAKPAATTRTDTAAVIAAFQTFLDAIATRDSVLAMSVVMADGVAAAAANDGRPARLPRVRSLLDDARRMGQPGGGAMLERIWAPKVLLDGTMAVLWAPYDFHVDGRFTHCGIDTATLFFDGTRWKILTLTYTVQPSGCPPTPLGAIGR